jgi:hypothetical protein
MNWKQYFEYRNGTLHRLSSNNQHTHVGSTNSNGYKQFEHQGRTYMLHRAIWEFHNGPIPHGAQIDHIDRDPLNNHIENLRVCTQSQNQINSKRPSNNTTGYKGVLATPSGKFQARLGYNGTKLYLGLFSTAEEAAECVRKRSLELFGEFTV